MRVVAERCTTCCWGEDMTTLERGGRSWKVMEYTRKKKLNIRIVTRPGHHSLCASTALHRAQHAEAIMGWRSARLWYSAFIKARQRHIEEADARGAGVISEVVRNAGSSDSARASAFASDLQRNPQGQTSNRLRRRASLVVSLSAQHSTCEMAFLRTSRAPRPPSPIPQLQLPVFLAQLLLHLLYMK